MSRTAVHRHLSRAVDAFASIFKSAPRCSAAPAWVCTPESLELQESLGLDYASDTRGRTPFYPIVDGRTLRVPQIPVTAPTLDELLGHVEDPNAQILDHLRDGGVHAMHAEAEGRAYSRVAEDLLRALLDRQPVEPLGGLSATHASPIVRREIPGRAGLVCVQA
jgi:peptidoglycan/xylan/chitin deacetylase (PgdA/CDA1 family)